MFDEENGIFCDRLVGPDGDAELIRVQTLVGVIPALPVTSLPEAQLRRLSRLRKRFVRRMEQAGRSELKRWRLGTADGERRVLLSVVPPDQLRQVFATLFDEQAFLSPRGLRSLSKRHTEPYEVPGIPGAVIDYQPAESRTAMYGGNSNWRGPVWFPTNYLVIRSLLQYERFFGADFTVEYPTGSGRQATLREVSADLSERLIGIWRRGPDGRRPVYGDVALLQDDPAWRDNLLFFEHFNGDDGSGLGASHQTGWTALVIDLIIDPPRDARLLLDYVPTT